MFWVIWKYDVCYSLDVNCISVNEYRVLFTGPIQEGKACYIYEWPSSNQQQETYNLQARYANPNEIVKVDFQGEPGHGNSLKIQHTCGNVHRFSEFAYTLCTHCVKSWITTILETH